MLLWDIDTDLLGFVVTMLLGYFRTVQPIPRPNGLGIATSYLHVPSNNNETI